MSLKKISLLLVIILALVSVFMLLPRHRCGDENDVTLYRLTDLAASGDLAAISTLYNFAKEDGVRPLQEYWAFRGAMEGDPFLRKQYIEIYVLLDKEKKEHILETIRKDMSHPGAKCLLASLQGDSEAEKCTP